MLRERAPRAQRPGRALDPALDEHFHATRRRLGIPGAVLAVHHSGTEAFAAGGITSVEYPQPISEDSIFRIASLTKMLTATLVMRLVHMGEVGLDVPVRHYMPELRLADADVARSVTLRHLLSHTGGWLDDPLMDTTADQNILDVLRSLPQLTPLGTTWSYSTTGFFIAGAVVERATTLSYSNALAELLTRPLGMTRTGVRPEEAVTHSVAVGHAQAANKWQVVRPWPTLSWDVAAQGAFSTARDLLRFARFHLNGQTDAGEVIIAPELLAQMRDPQVADRSRGLGWVLRDADGQLLPNHPGGLYGYACDMLLGPSENFAIVVAANVSNHALDRSVLSMAVERFLGLRDREVVPGKVPLHRLREYEGRYIGVSRDLHITASDGHLIVQIVRRSGVAVDGVERQSMPAPIPVGLYDKDRVIVLAGSAQGDARGQFIRGEDGAILFLRFPTFMHVRYPSRVPLPDEYIRAHQQE